MPLSLLREEDEELDIGFRCDEDRDPDDECFLASAKILNGICNLMLLLQKIVNVTIKAMVAIDRDFNLAFDMLFVAFDEV